MGMIWYNLISPTPQAYVPPFQSWFSRVMKSSPFEKTWFYSSDSLTVSTKTAIKYQYGVQRFLSDYWFFAMCSEDLPNIHNTFVFAGANKVFEFVAFFTSEKYDMLRVMSKPQEQTLQILPILHNRCIREAPQVMAHSQAQQSGQCPAKTTLNFKPRCPTTTTLHFAPRVATLHEISILADMSQKWTHASRYFEIQEKITFKVNFVISRRAETIEMIQQVNASFETEPFTDVGRYDTLNEALQTLQKTAEHYKN